MKMKNKTTLLAVATLATLAIANNVKADAQDAPVSSQEASELVSTTAVENNTTAPESATESSTKAPTTITKEGTEITVTNPEVVVDQSNGNGKYQPFTVEYKNIHFDDNMAINEGDKVKFTLPEEVKFQTSFDFDVYNPDKQVVGKATTDAENNTVTTVFNNYFASHPLNKQMSLKLDATWTDKVQSGKPVTANFNGTLVTTQIGKEQVIGKDELLSKWGSQDKDDPTVINWTARVNYAKRVLNYVKIIDEMSENQKLVDNFFEVKNIESVDPWIDKGDAMDLVKSISKSEHGFTITMDRLDHMIYINYKTKLTKPVKESFNPTNKIEIKAESDGGISHSYVQLVGGKGDASGENKPEPTWGIPNDFPIVDKPSIDPKDVPMVPPAPIVEIPEWKGGTTPWDAPKYEKPEWHGGIPGIPEEREKPYLPIEDVPNIPAPIIEKPYLPIPEEPMKPHEDPKTPPVTPEDKPKVPSESPKVEPKKEEVKVENKGEVSHETPVETYKAPMLPQTGSQTGVALSVLGLTVLSLTVAFKKKEN
jgi:LPXTG-motif cell wall-anchored protein